MISKSKKTNIMRTSFSQKDDLFIIHHAYFDLSFADLAYNLKKSNVSLYNHILKVFNRPVPCSNHQIFQNTCHHCHLNWITWHNYNKNLIYSSVYNIRSQKIQYTKEIDEFIISHAYNDMSFSEIEHHFNFKLNAIATHINVAFGGSPRCDQHTQYDSACSNCQLNIIQWRKKNRSYINTKIYQNYDQKLVQSIQLLQKHKEKNRKKSLINRTIQYKDIISEEIYDKVIDFMCNYDIMKGRKIEDVFSQVSMLYIYTYLHDYNFLAEIPFNLLQYVFSIKKNFTILAKLHTIFVKNNIHYKKISSYLLFTIKDIMRLQYIFEDTEIKTIFKALYKFNIKSHISIQESNCAVLFYLYLKNHHSKITQNKLSQIFNITTSTLRNRVKLITHKHQHYMKIFFKDIQNINFSIAKWN